MKPSPMQSLWSCCRRWVPATPLHLPQLVRRRCEWKVLSAPLMYLTPDHPALLSGNTLPFMVGRTAFAFGLQVGPSLGWRRCASVAAAVKRQLCTR